MKNIIAVILTIALIIGVIVPVSAAADYKALAADKYKDVEKTDWFAEYVGKLTELNIVNGYNGAFDPSGYMTRAQFIKMLVQAMDYQKIDSVSFVDLKPFPNSKPHWASVYIETALRNGVILKDEEGDRFYPDVPLLRRDMAIMMCRALKLEPSDGTNPFVDLTEPNGYITKLYEQYLLLGEFVNGMRIYKPSAISSRAEVTAIISRMLDYKADPEGYVARIAREERIANGTATEADLGAVRQEEIARAKADPNYIMEPIITVEYNTDPWTYEYFRLYFENIADYSGDCKWKLECVNYPQLNVIETPKPNGTYVKHVLSDWRPFDEEYQNGLRLPCHILGKNYYTTQALIKDFKLYPGMKLQYKITISKGTKESVIYKTIEIPKIDFKG